MSLSDLSGTELGRYRIEERLGTGSVAVVYRAFDRPADRRVALKVLDPRLAGSPGFLPRFTREVAAMAWLDHPGIVPVYEVGGQESLTYVSSRLVHGATLKSLLEHQVIDLAVSRRVANQVGSALHRAHESGLVHRNLKPGNVMFDSDGSAVVTDFGLAPVRYGRPEMTPGYASPEQASGQEVDRRTDVHALGVLLFEMLTGTRPYRGDSPAQVLLATVNDPVPSLTERDPELPVELDALLSWSLAKDPGDRPASVLDFLEALDRVAPEAAGAARTGGPRALSDPGSAPALAIDGEGRIRQWTRRAELAFGWAPEQMIGEPAITRLIAPPHRELFERVLAAVAAGHIIPPAGNSVEVAAIHHDGHALDVELTLSPVRVPGGETLVVATCRDRTSLRAAERPVAAGDAAAQASRTVLAGKAWRRSRKTGSVRYKLDQRNTHLAFSCRFMRFMTVHGIFRDVSGHVEIVGDDATTALAECTIRTASVDTGSLDRDFHLASPDFFDCRKYPHMTFRSTAVEPLGDERFWLSGELTIRRTTRLIKFEVRLEDRETDAAGVERATFTAGTVINRSDWFLDWEKALQAGRWIIGDEVRLDLVITLVRHPPLRGIQSLTRVDSRLC